MGVLWFIGFLGSEIGKDELKPGDHIYTWRTAYLYAHQGIYAGDDKVIHFVTAGGYNVGIGSVMSSSSSSSATPCPKCGDQSRLGGVICSCIDCFLSGGVLYLFKYSVSRDTFRAHRGGTCKMEASDPPAVVLDRAFYFLQNGFGVYDFQKNNCENFAIYCKTGLRLKSGQVASCSLLRA